MQSVNLTQNTRFNEKNKEERNMKTWSVQLEGTLWTDDTYNGTFEECVEYCKNNGYQIGAGARLAEII